MFDWLLPDDHAIAILKKDHDKVKDLFTSFEKAEGAAKKKIVREAVTELKIHAVLEEEIFYPAVRRHVGSQIMNEADEEHHVAKVLIAELDRGVPADHQDAKFTVLSESVRHHIKEEESDMLPKASELKIDFEALGKKMLARKADLLKHGIPLDTEHAMIAAAAGKTDSPAAAAKSAGHTKKTNRKPASRKTVSATTRRKSRSAGK